MPWLEVSIRTSRDFAEQVALAMEAQQAMAVTTQAAGNDSDRDRLQTSPNPVGAAPSPRPAISFEDEVYEPEPGTTPLWPEVEVRGLFDAGVSRPLVVEALMDTLGIDTPEPFRWRQVEDQAWERAWLDRFEPMRFGKKLWIVPRGMASQAGRGATVIRLDPGLAFGTGAHATTALCLEWLDRARLKGKLVVDYGCGSGVLAIAAALKGARRVIAVDTDPQALEACDMNARNNHVHGQVAPCRPAHYHAVLSDTLRGLEGVDLVLANILARPLIKLAPVLTDSLRKGGKLVLSGLLDAQADSVSRAYLRAFGKLSVTKREGWARLEGKKRVKSNA